MEMELATQATGGRGEETGWLWARVCAGPGPLPARTSGPHRGSPRESWENRKADGPVRGAGNSHAKRTQGRSNSHQGGRELGVW